MLQDEVVTMGKTIHDLREMLCDELESLTDKGNMNAERLKMIDMLTHSIKSIDTIVAMDRGGYSNKYSYDNDRTYSDSRNGGRSYTSGRYDDRYSDGYSRDDMKASMVHKLNDMMREAESDKDREAIRRCIEQMGA